MIFVTVSAHKRYLAYPIGHPCRGKLPAMAMTEPTDTLPVTPQRGDGTDLDDEPGWISRVVRRDPVAVVAAALILIQLAWRAKIGAAGYLSLDDFVLAARSVGQELNFSYLTGHFNNHMMPAGVAYTWLVTKAAGYVYWPYLVFMLTIQALAGIALFRLLRLMTTARWGLLIPLTVFLFTPLNMETTTWWAFGMLMLPMQLAMIWAIGAMTKYTQTRRHRHLVSISLALLFGLAFGEKALLIIPLLFGLTACLLVRGSFGRSIWRALTGYWPAWLVLTAIAVPYVIIYLRKADTSYRRPESFEQVSTFAQQFFLDNLIPGLAGGPWQWYEQLPAPGTALKTVALLVVAAVIAATVWRRPRAGRAWLLAGGYALLAASLIATSRLGYGDWSELSGLILRYSSDTVVVVVICLAAALFGVRGMPDRRPPRPLPGISAPAAKVLKPVTAVVVLALFTVGSAISTSAYAQHWAGQSARGYVETARASLAKAPPGTVYFDRLVPPHVVSQFSAPYNKQSKFFAAFPNPPVFVTQAERPSVIDDSGHIKLAAVVKGVLNLPGDEGGCRYRIGGGTPEVAIPMEDSRFEWIWVLRIAYTATGTSRVEVHTEGRLIGEFTAQPGERAHHLAFVGTVGKVIDLKVIQPDAEICANELYVGELAPWIE